ncbi:hypothetical protein WMF28_36405 [Sorangium sp. So ce590]|uniref:hypothetical protein n=1 Tax=Sorangium sp. So ce590 TaxID=3133317 RepID=UPI003F61C10B
MTTGVPAADVPLPSRAERGTWEGRAARRPEGPSTDRGWASILLLLFLLAVALKPVGDTTRAIQSQGEDEARAYAVGEVAPRPPHPTVEMERIQIEDPRRVPAPREGARRGGGARNPAQRAPLADVGAPGVSMPEGLPVTKRQPIVIDSEILAEWHGGRGEDGGAAGSEAATGDAAAESAPAGSAGAAGGAPRLAEIAAARRAARRAGGRRAAAVLVMGVLLAIAVAVVRSGRGARDGAGEVARGAGGAAQAATAAVRQAEGMAVASAGVPVASAVGPVASAAAPVASEAAPVGSAVASPVASVAPTGAAVSARPMPRVEAAAMTAQQSRRGAPAASQRASPGASGSAAPARDAPKRPAGAAPARAGPDAPPPPSPYDTPNFD